MTGMQRMARFVLFIVLVAALGAASVACGTPAAPSPTPAPVTSLSPPPLATPIPEVTPPPVPATTTTFYDCYFEYSEAGMGQEFKWERIPMDLKKGDIVAVSIDCISSGQRVSVGVKDPAGGDLLTFQYGADRTVTFKAETNGTHIIIVAQDDQRGGAPVTAIVRYYPAGS